MDKIYSRPNLFRFINTKTGGNNPRIKYHKKMIITMFVVIVIACFTARTIIIAITPVIERECRVIARSTASKYSNEACNKAMQNLTYEDLCTIDKDEEGKVRLIKMNSIEVNKLNSQIALEVQDRLNNTKSSKFYIKLGTFTGSKILCGRGPDIEIRMSTIGEVTTEIKSEFESAGVNQVLHKIKININCNVSLLTPFKDVDERITAQVLLSEALITGDIPESYYDLDGMTEGDTMNMMN